ncbi:hypothetical protein MSAN_00871100 [Mycena sanguinolenta]|uniref:Uncharacterized protein n=1 Tax=Mycena sanguinolenta TaxID=230812 RepID=A0A8H7DCP6_9AGAR|nr:hypothetical protein MSAN_00871100 [Mycena sanguinolenta]
MPAFASTQPVSRRPPAVVAPQEAKAPTDKLCVLSESEPCGPCTMLRVRPTSRLLRQKWAGIAPVLVLPFPPLHSSLPRSLSFRIPEFDVPSLLAVPLSTKHSTFLISLAASVSSSRSPYSPFAAGVQAVPSTVMAECG